MTKQEKNTFIKKMVNNAFSVKFHSDNKERQEKAISWFLAIAQLYEELTNDVETVHKICLENKVEFLIDKYGL